MDQNQEEILLPVSPEQKPRIFPTKMLFLILGIVLLLILLSIGIYTLSNKNTPGIRRAQTSIKTSTTIVPSAPIQNQKDWLTYTDNNFGYSIQYPKTLPLVLFDYLTGAFGGYYPETEASLGNNFGGYLNQVNFQLHLPNANTIRGGEDIEINVFSKCPAPSDNAIAIVVSGNISANRTVVASPYASGAFIDAVAIPKGNLCYDIQATYAPEDKQSVEQVFNRMIMSFQILDPLQIVKNWQTYSNSSSQISFLYPTGWSYQKTSSQTSVGADSQALFPNYAVLFYPNSQNVAPNIDQTTANVTIPIQLAYYGYPTQNQAQEVYNEYLQDYKYSVYQLKSYYDFTLNGNDVKLIYGPDYRPDPQNPSKVSGGGMFITQRNKSVLLIEFRTINNVDYHFQAYQMLQSFHFPPTQ